MWWIRSPRGSTIRVNHLHASASAGQKVYAEGDGMAADVIIDSRMVACSYEWDAVSETWQIRINAWVLAP